MADPVRLAVSIPLPVAVERGGPESDIELKAAALALSAQKPKLPQTFSAYQALPITGRSLSSHATSGTVSVGRKITQNYAAPLDVIPANDDEPRTHQEKIDTVIQDYVKRLEERTKHHLGYPYNLDFDYGPLEALQKFSINNLGDPFIESNYGVHSREFEVGVLHWFARLWELEPAEMWGYITNCGTEGNLHGILVGRENLPDGILYCSKESHYSVMKAARMYRMDAVEVATLPSGEMDYDKFEQALRENADRPAIVNVNIGTTVKGAVDNLDTVIDVLRRVGFNEDRFYIHCDGALFGMMMPFIKSAPMVTFKKPIGSVSVSGHKFVGAPVPCGVVMTRMRLVMALSSDVEYLNSRDATIMGSRNGHAAIYLWYNLTKKGYEGFRKDVEVCMRNAHFLREMISRAGIWVMLNELSNTVVFERPASEAFVRKWQLACEGNIAHVVVMPNVSIQKLQDFVEEMVTVRQESVIRGIREMVDAAQDLQGTSPRITAAETWEMDMKFKEWRMAHADSSDSSSPTERVASR